MTPYMLHRFRTELCWLFAQDKLAAPIVVKWGTIGYNLASG
jgi:hypothetical protein